MVLRRRGFFQPHPRLLATATDRRGLSVGLGSANVPVMTGHPKMAMINNSLTLTINVVANLVLIPRMGIMGAAVGSLIALNVPAVARLLEVLVIHRLHPFTAHQFKPLVAGLVFTGVYFSVVCGLRPEPEDREVLRAFQRKFKRWRS